MLISVMTKYFGNARMNSTELSTGWSEALAGQWLQKLGGFDLKVDPGSQGSNEPKN